MAGPPDDGHTGSFTRPGDVLVVGADTGAGSAPDLHRSPEEGVQQVEQEDVVERERDDDTPSERAKP